MAKTDPYPSIVLNFISRLKEIGAQLAIKSTRSLSLTLYPDALASLAAGDKQNSLNQPQVVARLNDQRQPPATQKHQQQQQQQQHDSGLVPAASTVPFNSLLVSAVNGFQDEPEEPARGPSDSEDLETLELDGSEEEDGGETDYNSAADIDPAEAGEQADYDTKIECKTQDCTDLLTEAANGIGSGSYESSSTPSMPTSQNNAFIGKQDRPMPTDSDGSNQLTPFKPMDPPGYSTAYVPLDSNELASGFIAANDDGRASAANRLYLEGMGSMQLICTVLTLLLLFIDCFGILRRR